MTIILGGDAHFFVHLDSNFGRFLGKEI